VRPTSGDVKDHVATKSDHRPLTKAFSSSGTGIASIVPPPHANCGPWESATCLPAPDSPWQNGFVERLIGSIRRECLIMW
jgi:hypothetical protein